MFRLHSHSVYSCVSRSVLRYLRSAWCCDRTRVLSVRSPSCLLTVCCLLTLCVVSQISQVLSPTGPEEPEHPQEGPRAPASHMEKDLIRELWFIEHGIEEKQKENKLVSGAEQLLIQWQRSSVC